MFYHKFRQRGCLDFALKLVRRYFKGTADPERWRWVAFNGAIQWVRSIGRYRRRRCTAKLMVKGGYEPVVPGLRLCSPSATFTRPSRPRSGRRTAAILLEPGSRAGMAVSPRFSAGVHPRLARDRRSAPATSRCWTRLRPGSGRGARGQALLPYEWAEMSPDIVAVAKGLGAGFPLGATLATAAVANHYAGNARLNPRRITAWNVRRTCAA